MIGDKTASGACGGSRGERVSCFAHSYRRCRKRCEADYQVCVKQTTRSASSFKQISRSVSRSVSSRQPGLCQADYQVPCSLLQCQCVAACCSVLQCVVRPSGLETSVLNDATGVCVASLLSDATGACAIRLQSHSYQWFISMSSKVTQWRRRRRYPSTLHAAPHLTSRTCAFAYLRTYRILPLMKVQVDRHRHR